MMPTPLASDEVILQEVFLWWMAYGKDVELRFAEIGWEQFPNILNKNEYFEPAPIAYVDGSRTDATFNPKESKLRWKINPEAYKIMQAWSAKRAKDGNHQANN
jgi:hypothetical protein